MRVLSNTAVLLLSVVVIILNSAAVVGHTGAVSSPYYLENIRRQLAITETAYKHWSGKIDLIYAQVKNICREDRKCFAPEIPQRQMNKHRKSFGTSGSLNFQQIQIVLKKFHHNVKKIVCYYERLASMDSNTDFLLFELRKDAYKLDVEVMEELATVSFYKKVHKRDCRIPDTTNRTSLQAVELEVIQAAHRFFKEWTWVFEDLSKRYNNNS